jgi:hypothetical protein
VSLGELLDDKTWTVRVYHKPFVDWIWGGCLLMALGGCWRRGDRRYRAPRGASAQPQRRRLRRWTGARLMKARLFIPLALFLVLAVFLGVGLTLKPREVPSPLHRQAGTGLQPARS